MITIQIKVEECNVSNRPKAKQHYHMDMPHNDRVEKINIENISNIEKEDRAIN